MRRCDIEDCQGEACRQRFNGVGHSLTNDSYARFTFDLGLWGMLTSLIDYLPVVAAGCYCQDGIREFALFAWPNRSARKERAWGTEQCGQMFYPWHVTTIFGPLMRSVTKNSPTCDCDKQDPSGTATSEEYDKVSHGDAHSVENCTRVDQKSDGARGG